MAEWGWKWAHKVNTPNIKEFYYHNGVQRHHVFPENVSHGLTPKTSFGKSMSILKEGRPIESIFKHFCSSLFTREVTPTCKSMAKIQDVVMLSFRDTSPNDIVCTNSEEIWVLSNVVLVLREKSFSLLFGLAMWHLSYYFKVDNVRKPRKVGIRYCKKLFILEGLLDRFNF